MVDIRLPKITGATEREQLSQVKSYLYQLAEQLQFALSNIDTSASQGNTTPQVIVQGGSSAPMDAHATFSSVKGLIIKSADIVESFYDEINARLEGIYVAESDFGTYVQRTSQDIANTSTAMERSFTNVQEISGELANAIRGIKSEVDDSLEGIVGAIDNLNRSLVAVSANIKSGLLYYDNGIPIYGLEVGQRTMIDGVEVFDKFARFTSDKLSFYDQNDNEVAYISDRKLYINHVEIKGTLKMGGFVKTVLADRSIVKRWVDEGGDS